MSTVFTPENSDRLADNEPGDVMQRSAELSDAPDRVQPPWQTSQTNVVALLDLLEVQIDAFAMCEIEDCCGLTVPPSDRLTVHYVLAGEGTIVSEHGSLPIAAGMAVVIPRGLAKQINGRDPILTVSNADQACVLAPGLVKFCVSSGSERALMLGCASVEANLGHGVALFESLSQPLVYQDQSQIVPQTFKAILGELSTPGIGTKALVDTLMKQVLLLLVRESLKGIGASVPLEPLPVSCPIVRAINFIAARPQDAHSVDKLARVVGMSRSVFAQKFAEIAGTSPMRYVQAARLTVASRLLKDSTVPVKLIADSVGFASRSHFSRAFVTMFGVDPTTFRQRENIAAAGPTGQLSSSAI